MDMPKLVGRLYVFDFHKEDNKIFIEAESGVGLSSFIILSEQETKKYFDAEIKDLNLKEKNIVVEANIKEFDLYGIENYERETAGNELFMTVCKRQMFIPNYKDEKLERKEEYSVILRRGAPAFAPYYHIEIPLSEKEFRIIKSNSLDHMAEINLRLG